MNDPRLTLLRILGDGPVTWEEVEEQTALTRQEARAYLAGELADAGRCLMYRLLFDAHPFLETACTTEPVAEPSPVLVFHRAAEEVGQVLLSDGGHALRVFAATPEGYCRLRFLGDMPADGMTLYVDGVPLALATPFGPDGFAQVLQEDIRAVLDGSATLEMAAEAVPTPADASRSGRAPNGPGVTVARKVGQRHAATETAVRVQEHAAETELERPTEVGIAEPDTRLDDLHGAVPVGYTDLARSEETWPALARRLGLWLPYLLEHVGLNASHTETMLKYIQQRIPIGPDQRLSLLLPGWLVDYARNVEPARQGIAPPVIDRPFVERIALRRILDVAGENETPSQRRFREAARTQPFTSVEDLLRYVPAGQEPQREVLEYRSYLYSRGEQVVAEGVELLQPA
jgi:hypothetical protein